MKFNLSKRPNAKDKGAPLWRVGHRNHIQRQRLIGQPADEEGDDNGEDHAVEVVIVAIVAKAQSPGLAPNH